MIAQGPNNLRSYIAWNGLTFTIVFLGLFLYFSFGVIDDKKPKMNAKFKEGDE